MVHRQVEEEEEEETLQTKLSSTAEPLIQRQTEDEEEEMLQAKGRGTTEKATEDIQRTLHSLKGSGQRLPTSVRSFFEPRFGVDFSHVRVHTDSTAVRLSRQLNAEAFTYGRDIYFGEGRYNPSTASGKRLLAHELTHVMQQRRNDSYSKTLRRYPWGALNEWVVNKGKKLNDSEKLQKDTSSSRCPKNWQSIVNADHNRALNMIDVARQKLSMYNGTTPSEVRTALKRHFKAISTGFAKWINFNLWYLRKMAPLAGYDCKDTNSWWCGPGTLAKTFWCVPFVDIRVCYPLYFSQTPIERSATLIHEWVHKYGCNFDLGYSHEPGYQSQWTITALLNADPWSNFVKDVK